MRVVVWVLRLLALLVSFVAALAAAGNFTGAQWSTLLCVAFALFVLSFMLWPPEV